MTVKDIAAVLLAVGGLAAIVTVFPPSKGPSMPTKRCRSLPTAVVAYGISVHSVGDALYLCFQQGGAQGMTEVVCTPMKDCAP